MKRSVLGAWFWLLSLGCVTYSTAPSCEESEHATITGLCTSSHPSSLSWTFLDFSSPVRCSNLTQPTVNLYQARCMCVCVCMSVFLLFWWPLPDFQTTILNAGKTICSLDAFVCLFLLFFVLVLLSLLINYQTRRISSWFTLVIYLRVLGLVVFLALQCI